MDFKNIDAPAHVRGESVYLDDIPPIQGTLYACVRDAPIAHGRIRSIDLIDALREPGVKRIILAGDLPGENQIGGLIPDEPLLAETEVHFAGMPIAIVVADSDAAARSAASRISLDIEPLEVITDPRDAYAKGELIIPPRSFSLGDTASAFASCDHVVEGRADVNGQEHLYIETQGAYAVPMEGGGLRIYSSTQGPTAVQRTVARVTGLPMHLVEVDVTRLGGGFGGKEDQANAWAAICAVATRLTGCPVKYSLHRMEDMRMTGKRHPYSADFKIGLTRDLKIRAYEVVFYQNAGAAADLSPPVLERTLFHCTNAYYIPHVKATAYSCRTHLPPNTAFRGFGGPQGMFVIEAAIARAGEALGVPSCDIQRANLLHAGDIFPYGQVAESGATDSWFQADSAYDFQALRREAMAFNETHTLKKRGLAIMPVCFGISFTKTPMNQARALVHLYTDGSVSVSTGAVEMGQGVNTKILQAASLTLGISPHRVKVQSTNTIRIANTSPSAASATADLNGKATVMACEALLHRLKEVALPEIAPGGDIADLHLHEEQVFYRQQPSGIDWPSLLQLAWQKRVSLSEHAHYVTPGIYFDWTTAKGHPFAYHVHGTAVVQVTVDCLRGTYDVDFVKVVHDFGKSMNTAVDFGQIEGGITQGTGWMTLEEIVYDRAGILRSNALSNYKVPDIYAAPTEISILPLTNAAANQALFQSKAVGEPPLMYGIGVYFAIQAAVRSFRPDHSPAIDAPFTPEKVLMNLYLNDSPTIHETHTGTLDHGS